MQALEIISIILAVTFFLPLLILLFRALGIGLEKKHEIGPLTEAEIAEIPLVLYCPAPEDATEDAAAEGSSGVNSSVAASTAPTADKADIPAPATPVEPSPPAPRKRRRRLLRIFRHSRRSGAVASSGEKGDEAVGLSNGVYVPTPYPLRPLPANLSTCAVCLCGALSLDQPFSLRRLRSPAVVGRVTARDSRDRRRLRAVAGASVRTLSPSRMCRRLAHDLGPLSGAF